MRSSGSKSGVTTHPFSSFSDGCSPSPSSTTQSMQSNDANAPDETYQSAAARAAMNRQIVSFHEDPESHWIAELSCGHRRHTRHDPPFSDRPWVLTPEGRQSRIGIDIDCAACDRREIPAGYEPYRRTPVFDESSVPQALLRHHSTKRGVWARIRVTRGSLEYCIGAPFDSRECLTPLSPGVILPEVEHHVAARGPVSFFVEFLRPASVED
jgi:tellurite methyltransferase